jgi:hypothetical protein
VIALCRLEGIAVARTEKTESSAVGKSRLSVARSDERGPLGDVRQPSN